MILREVKWNDFLCQVVERGLMSTFIQAMAPQHPIDAWQDGVDGGLPRRQPGKNPTCHLVHLQNFGEICDFWDISIICITFVSVIWDWMRMGRCNKMVWRHHVIMETYDVLTIFALCRRIVAESLESITFSYDQTVHLPQINSSLHGFWSLLVGWLWEPVWSHLGSGAWVEEIQPNDSLVWGQVITVFIVNECEWYIESFTEPKS